MRELSFMSPSREVTRCKVNVGAYRLVKVRRYRAMRVPAGRMSMNEMPMSKPWIVESFLNCWNSFSRGSLDIIAAIDRQGSESGAEKGGCFYALWKGMDEGDSSPSRYISQ